KSGEMNFAIDDPSNPVNFPKLLFVWRANLIGSSAKGHEYFLKHLLGTHEGTLSEQEEEKRTNEIKWIEEVPEGKLDLLINYDFRMSGTGLYSDIVLPAATWYEKHDLRSEEHTSALSSDTTFFRAKGHEYFLKQLLGTHEGTLSEQEEEKRTNEIKWIEEVPEGKLDLLINYDFRMSGTGLYSDIVLPAATWYEKHDLSSTDMHPFVHPFN